MAWNQDYGEGANPGSGYEQQSWRDSFNGGNAAGDWTGNHNANLQSERDRFQGATWTGSSTQPSALELAQSRVGSVAGGGGASPGSRSAGTGPGNDGLIVQPGSSRKPSGGSLTLAGGGGPLTAKVKDTASGGWAGVEVLPNPWFSDVENWWEPRYGEPGEWLGGIVNIGADGLYTAGRFADWATGSDIVSGARPDKPVQIRADGALPGIVDAFERQGATWDRQLHEIFGAGRPYVGGGF